MKSLISVIGAILVAAAEVASAQAPSSTVDSYLGAAKGAAGTDWAGTFLRLCIPPPPAASQGGRGQTPKGGGRGAGRGTPAREIWYAEPAKVADNLYFLGTKIHSAWAVAGSEGIIVIEALFDYAAKDEILDGLKKVGLDPRKVKYVILSHAHADHDGGAKLLQDQIPDVRIVYGAEDSVPDSLDGWTEIGSQTAMKTHATVQLQTNGSKYRYYLLWITKLASTDNGYAVAISDARLFS